MCRKEVRSSENRERGNFCKKGRGRANKIRIKAVLRVNARLKYVLFLWACTISTFAVINDQILIEANGLNAFEIRSIEGVLGMYQEAGDLSPELELLSG